MHSKTNEQALEVAIKKQLKGLVQKSSKNKEVLNS
jgi:hypothetical protein